MTQSREFPTQNKFESGFKPPMAPEQLAATMASLATAAGEWTRNNGPSTTTVEQPNGVRVEEYSGLRKTDFKDFIRAQDPTQDEAAASVWGARLENDIIRFKQGAEMPDNPSGLDDCSETAVVSPHDIFKYSVHAAKETGIPFEGSQVQREIHDAISVDQQARGFADLQQPNAMEQRNDIMQTV